MRHAQVEAVASDIFPILTDTVKQVLAQLQEISLDGDPLYTK